jgi:hypothetical protein
VRASPPKIDAKKSNIRFEPISAIIIKVMNLDGDDPSVVAASDSSSTSLEMAPFNSVKRLFLCQFYFYWTPYLPGE